MKSSLLELAPELLELAFFAASSVALTVVGALIERFALATAQSGDLKIGLWAAVIGTVALYVAFLLATEQFPAKLAGIRAQLTDDRAT